MRKHKIELVEGGTYDNLNVPRGTTFPPDPDLGELFYRTDQKQLFICEDSVTPVWVPAGKLFTKLPLGENLTEGDVVRVNSSGEVVAITDKYEAEGILQQTGLTGEEKDVALIGQVSRIHSGLTPGKYYVTDLFAVSNTATNMQIGFALSATEILIVPDKRSSQAFSVADITARDALTPVDGDMALVADSDGLGNPSTFMWDDAGSSWLELQTTHDGGTYGP